MRGGGRREGGGRSLLACLAVGGLLGCGSGNERARAGESAATAAQAPAPSRLPRPSGACPQDGRWHVCAVQKRLEMAGLVPVVEDSSAREAPLSATGVRYGLGKSTLTVFVYPDERARAADAARLDTTRFIDPYQPVTLLNEPARIVSANLLAILRSTNEHQRERVADALTAGPPQRAP